MDQEGREAFEGRERVRDTMEMRAPDRAAPEVEAVVQRVIGLAIKVHRVVGPGLLEHVYEDCMALELTRSGLRFDRQVSLALTYEGNRSDRAYKAGLVVENAVILEIKSVEAILPVHKSQILTYSRLSGCHIGLLLNFNGKRLKDGLYRFIL